MMSSLRAVTSSALLVACILGLAVSCRREPPRRPDVVLVSIDTLRADAPSFAGNPREITPRLDAFRRGAVWFSQAIAAAPSTLSSHASLFTSQIPVHHGASFARRRRLPESAVTLAETLSAAGYRTVGFTAHGQLAREFGIAQGFELYRARAERHGPHAFRRTVRHALRQLGRSVDPRPLFLFLHTYEIHHPYTPDPDVVSRLDPGYSGTLGETISVELLKQINAGERDLDAADRIRIRAAYDAELASVDEAIGALFDGLAELGRFEDTLVVVTSDHGEEFGEHGSMGWHSHTLHDELLRVPLLVKLPRGVHGGAEIAEQVRLLDLAPTILDLVGLAAPPEFDGASLVPLLAGDRPPERPAIAALDVGGAEAADRLAIRWEGWKLIGQRLFDLATDPGETIDHAAAESERVRALARRLREVVSARPAGAGESAALDAEVEEELRALGYLN